VFEEKRYFSLLQRHLRGIDGVIFEITNGTSGTIEYE